MPKRFTVSDGKLVLFLTPAEDGWYAVTSPLDPAVITQAKSVEEAFRMAYDALKCLGEARAQLRRELGRTPTASRKTTRSTTRKRRLPAS